MGFVFTEKDIRIIPFSPLCEKDRAEFRIQFLNTGKSRNFDVKFYLNDKSNLIYSSEVFAEHNGFGFASCFKEMFGLAGRHTLLVEVDGVVCSKVFNVDKKPKNMLDGGFILLGGAENETCMDVVGGGMEKLDDKQWKTLINEYNEIGFKTIIIQMTVGVAEYENFTLGTYYPNSQLFPRIKSKANDAIKSILEQAEINGQNVFIGMCSPVSKRNVGNIIALVKEIYELYGDYSSFYGWYSSWEYGIPIEPNIDFMLSMNTEDIKSLRNAVNKICPVMPILYSPFMTALNEKGNHVKGVSTELLQAIYDGEIEIDILCPHDQCGQAHKMTDQSLQTVEDAVRQYATLKRACDHSKIHLWANIETFNFGFMEDSTNKKSDYYFRTYSLVPRIIGGGVLGPSGFVNHIREIRPYTEKNITFMISGLFQKPDSSVQLGNDDCKNMYVKYKEYLAAPYDFYENVAKGCSYTVKSDRPLDEPDNGHLFYDIFETGAQKILHPDKDKSGLLTDGLMSGAQTRKCDDYLVFGSQVYERGGKINIEVVIDLGKSTGVDAVRVMRPFNKDFSADKIVVSLSKNGEDFVEQGSVEKYVNGWAWVKFDEKIYTRFVKINYFKENNDDWKTWLLIDEAEVLSK